MSEPKLSVGLALDQVTEACADVNRLVHELEYARRERNRLLKSALAFVSVSAMMRKTGLSRDTLHRIKNLPED